MSIPRRIHYCWFGPDPLSERHQRCIESWRRHCPDYTFRCWSEDHWPEGLPRLDFFLRHRRWALVSDYVRMYALQQEGGVYLDVDVELLKSPDPLLEHDAFIGFQSTRISKASFCNAVLGGVPGHAFFRDCLEAQMYSIRVHPKPWYGVKICNRVLRSYGVKTYGAQTVRNVTLLEKDVLYPNASNEAFDPSRQTDRTLCRHYWEGSWHKRPGLRSQLQSCGRKLRRLPAVLRNRVKDVRAGRAVPDSLRPAELTRRGAWK